jgi:hypothetical protein
VKYYRRLVPILYEPPKDLSEPRDEREGEDKDRFAKTLRSVAGRRLSYDELTGKAIFN